MSPYSVPSQVGVDPTNTLFNPDFSLGLNEDEEAYGGVLGGGRVNFVDGFTLLEDVFEMYY